jgi:cyclomaltodextrinase
VPNESGITTFAYPVEDAVSPMPAWMDDAIVYHIFLDRFHPGTDDGIFPHIPQPCKRHGGTLRGVLRSLPYLADLGVNCLWFSPLHPSETYHRYDGMDFFGVDPDLGTEQDLRTLIDTAHALGMRIWLDFVPAHCSWHHPAFLAAQQDQQADTYSWFTFNEWPDDYRSFLQVARTLPSFDTDDPDARAYLIDSAVYWLREFGVDGFRLDHAIAPSMDFWLAFRQATEAARPDVVNVGEATDTPDCLRRYRGKLHGYLDFELARAFRLTFGTGDWTVGQFNDWLGSYEQYMEEGPGRISFLDNHDMDRFLWIARNDRALLRMAALCQFTLGATPVIYYGTEIGMTQLYGSAESGFGGDENARGDMPWDDAFWDRDMLAFYRRLIRMRKEQPVLGRGRRQAVHTSDEDATYVYLRCSSVEGVSASDILVVLNLGDNEAAIRLPDDILGSGLDCVVCTKDAPTWRDGYMVVARKSGAAFLIG